MMIRLLADREPYTSYVIKGDPEGSLSFCIEDAKADLDVLPAECFLALAPGHRPDHPVIAYGGIALMSAAFEAGCSDYLRDPWSLTELRARAERFGHLRFTLGTRYFELHRSTLSTTGGAELELGEAESCLLKLLVRNADEAVSRQAISLELWGQEKRGSRAIDVYVGHLRGKLESLDPEAGKKLISCRGLGYRLVTTACG